MGARALWQARRARVEHERPAEPAEVSLRRAYGQGLVSNFANPKAGVFAVSILPQFVPPGAPVLPVLLAFAVIWVVVDLVCYVPLVWPAGRVGGVLRRRPSGAGRSRSPGSSWSGWGCGWPRSPEAAPGAA
ncbi:LysE family translocator [Streptomyces sp. NPDC002076]